MAIDEVNAAWELLKKSTSIESQETIMALRENHLSLREEILHLKEENSYLKSKLENKDTLFYEDPYIWKLTDGIQEGPYCSLCYDRDQKLIRFQSSNRDGLFVCKACKHAFTDTNYKPRKGKSAGDYAKILNG